MKRQSRLMLVESPAKAKLLEKYLRDKDCRVLATMGHLYDIERNSKDFGITIENGSFKPRYILIKDREKIYSEIEEALKQSKELYIATDGDREGEAIGAHVVYNLKPKIPVRRVVFYEIVENVVLQSFANPREIDQNLVKAQEARRILDRLYGFKISQALWERISYKVSTGRVQSVVLREILDRELEIRRHIAREVHEVLVLYKGKQISKLKSLDQRAVVTVHDFDSDGKLTNNSKLVLEKKFVEDINSLVKSYSIGKEKQRKLSLTPKAPFNTASIQITAFTKFGMSNVQTMTLLQSLYNKGLITYMRTDSVEISDEAFLELNKYIKAHYKNTDGIISDVKRSYSTSNNKKRREAHEAIRPSLPLQSPKELQLPRNESKLYKMIFDRTVESQCTNATGYSRRFEVLCTLRDNSWNFKEASFDLSSTEITEKGFTQISSDEEYANSEEKEEWNKLIETLQEDKDKSLLFKSHSLLTSAQPRYNFGSIVKYMKNSGIGRPSTYSYIVNILLKHGYVSKIKEKLAPTITSLFIIQAFQLSIVHYLKSNFTAEMEDALDEITNNSTDLDRWLNNIYKESDHSILQLYEKILSIEKERVRSVKLDEMEIYISPNGSLSVSIDGDQERVPVINMPLNELTREAVERIKVDRKFMRNLGKVGNYDATVRKSHYGYYVMLKRSDKKERPRFYAIPKELSPYDCQLVELLKKNDKLKIFYDELEKKASSHNSVN